MKRLQTPACRTVLCLTLLLGAVILAACMNPIPTVPTATPVALSASSTIASSPTPIPASPTLAATRTPTSTRTRLPRPTATPRPTNTPKPTTYPTLDSQGRLNFVLQALKTTMGCELPCWWGITPGKTKWEEMVNTFAKQGIGFDPEQSNHLFLSSVGDKPYAEPIIDVAFQKENNLVQSISIKADYYHVLAQPNYSSIWQKHALDKVLSRSGIPTQIYLELGVGAADWSPGMQATYDLWLEYANTGVAFRYPGELIRDNQGWHVCPTVDNFKGMGIRLQSPESNTSVIGPELGNEWYGFDGNLKDLTGLTLQEFHKMFKQNPPQDCVYINAPEPWRYAEKVSPDKSTVMSRTQEENFLTKKLAGDSHCELPCWWDIVPGETTTQDAEEMFLQLGKSVSYHEDRRGLQYEASLFGRYSPYPFDYTVEHRWFDKNGLVNLLGVTGSALSWSPPQHFTQEWSRYALHQALARYGIPTKVFVHHWDFGWRYDITLVYEDKGFLIRYSGPIGNGEFEFTSDEPLDICPAQNKPTEITLWMTQPASKALANFEYGRWDLSPSHSSMPALEEITKMSVPDFYNAFLNPNTTTCLTVPRDKGEMAP